MAKNEFREGKPTMFLGIDQKEGLLYHRVREKDIDEEQVNKLIEDGYARKVSTNPKTNEEIVAYYKYWPSVTGYITGFKLDSDTPYGERLSITIEDETERNIINFYVYSSYNSMVGYAVDLARHVDNIPLDEQIIFSVNRKLKNEKGYLIPIISLNYFERMSDLGPMLIERCIKKEDIPPLKEKQIGGKVTYDSYDRDSFMYKYLQKFAEMVDKGKHRFGSYTSHDTYNPEEAPKSTTQQKSVQKEEKVQSSAPASVPAAAQAKEEEYEDLPF